MSHCQSTCILLLGIDISVSSKDLFGKCISNFDGVTGTKSRRHIRIVSYFICLARKL
uniref:Uncharacterized protein n=1 Tax=Arundo donax TaxID=35708 RepID=A0A0A8YBU9_ARUDO